MDFNNSLTAAGFACPLLGLHHLADQEAEHGSLADLYCSTCFGFAGDHFVDDLLERAGVADLPQPFALDDRVRRVARLEHLGEDVFGQLAADLALPDD